MRFGIYIREREAARVAGDPLLAEVEARDIEDALRVAHSKGITHMAGIMALSMDSYMGRSLEEATRPAEEYLGGDSWRCRCGAKFSSTRALVEHQHRAGHASAEGGR